ncbi:MAG: hypothetical protein JWM93_1116 [Frankiales bacterium]|nr:hypothetical protein [Frankiales bacterium]
MIGRLVGRGALAGLAAGLLAACYGLVLVEPDIQRAIDLESMKNAGVATQELLTRSQQRIGLVVGLALVGLMLGALYGVAMALVHRRRGPVGQWDGPVVWGEAVRMAAVGWAGLSLLPGLRYPTDPPGVGSSDTIGLRTDAWALSLAFCLFAVALAWRIGAVLVDRGVAQPWPTLAATVIVVAGLTLTFVLLPDSSDPVDIPAPLLWRFRITSFGSYVLLWGGMAVAFTLLTARERARASAARARVAI